MGTGGLLLWRPNNETNKIDLCLSSLMCRHPEGNGEECTYMSQCVYVCVKERMHIFMHVCMYVLYMHIHIFMCIYVCTYVCMCVCIVY